MSFTWLYIGFMIHPVDTIFWPFTKLMKFENQPPTDILRLQVTWLGNKLIPHPVEWFPISQQRRSHQYQVSMPSNLISDLSFINIVVSIRLNSVSDLKCSNQVFNFNDLKFYPVFGLCLGWSHAYNIFLVSYT